MTRKIARIGQHELAGTVAQCDDGKPHSGHVVTWSCSCGQDGRATGANGTSHDETIARARALQRRHARGAQFGAQRPEGLHVHVHRR